MSAMQIDGPVSADLDAPVPILSLGGQQMAAPTILCCNCGAPIDGTRSANALCNDCVKQTVDISAGIPREGVLHLCRDCDRWLLPPTSWASAAPESRELLALCLKKLRGLHRVRVVDASFVWTEPHSRRVRVRLRIQDAVAEGVVLQQTFEVIFVVVGQQCPDCAKSYTTNVWRACVQVRQKVAHKRTFLLLEQLILKHGAHTDTLNIKEARDGIDFYFAARNQAERFVDFLTSVVPVRVKKSQELISQDIHTSTKSYKFTFSAELVPICRDDLVALPIRLAAQLGNISPLVLCRRVGASLGLLDPATLQTADLGGPIYWRAPFCSLADARQLVEFVVVDIEPTMEPPQGRWQLSEATIARVSDLSTTYFTRTHLGSLLRTGDSAMGYMMTGSNFNNTNLDAIEASSTFASRIPDVILVRKHYPRNRRNRRRHWKLKRMAAGQPDAAETAAPNSRNARGVGGAASVVEADYEMFLRDVEEDEELRQALTLYRNTTARKPVKQTEEMSLTGDNTTEGGPEDGMDEDGHDDAEGELTAIRMDELLEDFDELTVEDS